jgi:hypothetical protein
MQVAWHSVVIGSGGGWCLRRPAETVEWSGEGEGEEDDGEVRYDS